MTVKTTDKISYSFNFNTHRHPVSHLLLSRLSRGDIDVTGNLHDNMFMGIVVHESVIHVRASCLMSGMILN